MSSSLNFSLDLMSYLSLYLTLGHVNVSDGKCSLSYFLLNLIDYKV